MIYTTYFAKLRYLPKDIVPIAICAKPPSGYTGQVYRTLAPKYDFFKRWQDTKNNAEFAECYTQQVLAGLNSARVVSELYYLADKAACSGDIALVCYEKSSDFCHRHLVAEWLRNSGYSCEEFK